MQLDPAIYFFKDHPRPIGSIGQTFEDVDDHEKSVEDRGTIFCRACGQVITHEKERFAVHGSHRHSFANPHGLVFDIGCFQSAPGCTYEGAFTAEFAWFSGFQWKIALCRGCLVHLGWLFVSSSNRFDGLIIDRLVSWW